MTEMPVFDRRMSDAEALMWRLEKDPHLSSTFANITLLDRPPDFDRLLRRMERATTTIPRLRQRVQPGVANPVWVDDPNFDLRQHVRHIALPKPGTMRQLLDLGSLITNDPYDRTRPLWQFVVVDGLKGGKSALIEKLHHTIVDGEGGVKLSLEFLDFERDAPEPPAVDPALATTAPAPDQAPVDLVRELFATGVRFPLTMAKQVRDLMSDGALSAVVRQLNDTGSAQAPLWTQRSLGAPVDTLRSSMAISTRTDTSGPNAFSLVRMSVPTGEMPMSDRFRAITAAADHARSDGTASAMNALAAIATNLPTSLLTRIARQQAQTVDFATSNVRGAPMPLYLAGAEVLQNYPVGPLAGVAYNLTLLSYHGSLDMGVNIDTAAVTDPELLRAFLEQAFADLVAAR